MELRLWSLGIFETQYNLVSYGCGRKYTTQEMMYVNIVGIDVEETSMSLPARLCPAFLLK